MAIQPLDDRILVKRLESEEKTQGGIVIPDTAKEKPQKGKVIAVGPGKILDDGNRAEMSVKENDIILFGKYSGTEVKIGGEEHIIMRESEVLAVFED